MLSGNVNVEKKINIVFKELIIQVRLLDIRLFLIKLERINVKNKSLNFSSVFRDFLRMWDFFNISLILSTDSSIHRLLHAGGISLSLHQE